MISPPQLMATWPIVTNRDGLFRHSPDGAAATVLLVRDAEGSITDAVAWFNDEPGRWWLRMDEAIVLGSRALFVASHEREPIELHSTPAVWLAAPSGPCVRAPGRCTRQCQTCEMERGVTILNWGVPLATLLADVAEVRCDSSALRDRVLTRWSPRVTTTGREVHRAV